MVMPLSMLITLWVITFIDYIALYFMFKDKVRDRNVLGIMVLIGLGTFLTLSGALATYTYFGGL